MPRPGLDHASGLDSFHRVAKGWQRPDRTRLPACVMLAAGNGSALLLKTLWRAASISRVFVSGTVQYCTPIDLQYMYCLDEPISRSCALP